MAEGCWGQGPRVGLHSSGGHSAAAAPDALTAAQPPVPRCHRRAVLQPPAPLPPCGTLARLPLSFSPLLSASRGPLSCPPDQTAALHPRCGAGPLCLRLAPRRAHGPCCQGGARLPRHHLSPIPRGRAHAQLATCHGRAARCVGRRTPRPPRTPDSYLRRSRAAATPGMPWCLCCAALRCAAGTAYHSP